MSEALRILHLEDDARDAELVHGVLEAGGIASRVTRVATRDDFVAGLEANGLDLVIADFSLPGFDGMSALHLARQRRPELPFIFVSGTLGEELAVEALKIGASDYVLKERLSRIVGSVRRAMRETAERTERKRLEARLRQVQRLEAMGKVAGGIAHDFNNLLGAILGYGERALRATPRSGELREDLDSVMAAAERGRALVERMLAFTRGDAGERGPVHVEKVVREALDLLSARLPAGIRLDAKLRAGRAALVGDPTQLHQIVMNLGTNAAQAMGTRGTLAVSLAAVRADRARAATIGTVAAADYVILTVADSGAGIDPALIEHIFEPFFTTKEVGTGTGLGLSIVHSIVTELDGAVDVSSTPGQGSTFTVYLPRSGDALDSLQDEKPELPRGEGQCVLIVDDEEPLVRLATRTLEELGYQPVGFTSSAAALAAFRADPQRFDAVITDERMPDMSGSALIREVRGIRRHIPIVLMSGFVGGTVASGARDAGAEEVLKKPLSARDLAASLARVLAESPVRP